MKINKQPKAKMHAAGESVDTGALQGAQRATGDATVSTRPLSPSIDSEVLAVTKGRRFTNAVDSYPRCVGTAVDKRAGGEPLTTSATEQAGSALSASGICAVLKRFFRQAATSAGVAVLDAQRFEKASTHWMRHTVARQALVDGVPIEVASELAGHASITNIHLFGAGTGAQDQSGAGDEEAIGCLTYHAEFVISAFIIRSNILGETFKLPSHRTPQAVQPETAIQ